ncbi:Asp23/Gls24 family envelope stress response protein [Anaerofustis stercorihominis]|uniref:Asp23/Gls24 family envelope stress response protein n=1 Tax=Anaerofustis stercorihominis TaxID=214853 RepID=A0A3E3E3Z8_9FIRM|nr:Asp23/Gls24 family envelope stress response protein [Anaerofustis stercorihominis]RGD75628.1 Asp23/Gls24 family envelope stress response protein [Anaerofustis stercorihominis]
MSKNIEENIGIKETLEKGDELNISENVITSIVGLVTAEIDGISGFYGGLDIGELFGKKNVGKGVKTIISGKKLIIDVSLIIKYGAIIPELTSEVKKKVKQAIESMTGYSVIQVNIYVEGLEC